MVAGCVGNWTNRTDGKMASGLLVCGEWALKINGQKMYYSINNNGIIGYIFIVHKNKFQMSKVLKY